MHWKTVAVIFLFWSMLPQHLLSKSEQDHLLEWEKNNINIFRNVSPQVVNISNKRYLRNLFSFRAQEVDSGSGTGFFWDNKGNIVTNYHVIDHANKILVTLKDGQSLEASFVGGSQIKDIAVLQIDLKNIQQKITGIKKADSSTLQVGQKTIAIGSPFGFDQSLTVGVISATGRSIVGYGNISIKEMIQTDAPINPGNSGGPLLDSQGALIGMNTSIFSKSGGSQGIGFAIPSQTIIRSVSQILQFGRVLEPSLGMVFLPDHYKAAIFGKRIPGLVIQAVHPKTPAFKTGLRGLSYDKYGRLQVGDILTHIDGKAVDSFDNLYNILDSHSVGDHVKVKIKRGRQSMVEHIELVDGNLLKEQ